MLRADLKRMTDQNRIDLEDGDDLLPVTRESSRGGNEPPAEVNDRPDQNVGYDQAVKGSPLTDEERRRAEKESPLSEQE
jgi:hypothetical protein